MPVLVGLTNNYAVQLNLAVSHAIQLFIAFVQKHSGFFYFKKCTPFLLSHISVLMNENGIK